MARTHEEVAMFYRMTSFQDKLIKTKMNLRQFQANTNWIRLLFNFKCSWMAGAAQGTAVCQPFVGNYYQKLLSLAATCELTN